MKFKPSVAEHHPAYGFVFDIDILEDLYNIGWSEEYFKNTDASKFKTNLAQPNTRSVLDLTDYSDGVCNSIYNNIFSYDNIVRILQYDDQVYDRFFRLYPFRDNHDLLSFCKSYFNVHCCVTFDQTTYKLGKHVDNRLIIGNFIINLRDNDDSTKFWLSTYSTDSYYTAPTKKGTGVFFLNTEQTTHSIDIHSEKERSVLMVALTVKT